MMKKKILIIAAHPDDEVLGCGGTVAKMTKKGQEAYTIILGEGITSRDGEKAQQNEDLEKLKEQACEANRILGVEEVFFGNFPDNRFDSVDLLEIIKFIEKIKKKIMPDMVFTHYCNDLNNDHRLTYQAVLTAMRPMHDESVRTIYSFEVPSSTEWNYPLSFSPNVFFDVSDTINAKVEALKIYATEVREFPHPRSEEFLRGNAKIWGAKTGLQNAEAFELVRSIYEN